ncbi:MAG TPA: ATP-binding cassette domain-containing protein, partial [Ramlibacter sp.]|nr:ATP-binding cassette domain-containing protein [Ramlibacter sp.]
SIVFDDADITRTPPAQVAQRGMIRSFQISAIFGELTVHENVRVALQRRASVATQFWRSDATLRQLDEQADALLESVRLVPHRDTPASGLSYGRKRVLELATTLALEPRMLLLDEPMAGLAHEDFPDIVALIRKDAQGRTVLMVEHNLSVVRDLCDTVTVLARGEVIAQGSYATVSSDARVREAYMGTDDD